MAEGPNNTFITFKNSTNSESRLKKASVISYILPVICLIIFFGNLLVLLTIKTFRVHRVPDLLIGGLALVDLINDIGPVLISAIIHMMDPQGFKALGLHPLCKFYNWAATFLRVLACFITTVMSLDRLCATLWPLFYRTKVTLTAVVYTLLGTSLSAAFIASWPAMGWGEVFPHVGICSFDFGGSYAYVIAILGYAQLVIVLTCFIGVAHTIRKFRRRLDALKCGQPMVLRSGQVEVQCQSSGTRAESTKKNPPAESRQSKESRLFVKITGIVVLLFYISWLPIIFSISVELITQRQNDNLQSLSAQMSIFGSLINPLVYCVMCAPYRRGYIYVIRKACSVCVCCVEPERETNNVPKTAAVAPSMQGNRGHNSDT